MKAPVVIAEIGCNHKGSMEIAREMIQVAAVYTKVDAVKFQKRNPRELLSPEEYDKPHPNPVFAYGPSYGLHREALEFDLEQHRELQKCCQEFGIDYSASVWDLTSARELASLRPRWLKVPSACNLNRPLLEYLCDHFEGEIHISLGMTTHEEQDRIVGLLEEKGRARDSVLYACTSGYPVPFEDIGLFEVSRLRERYGQRLGAIAFSGHHLGIAADIAAMTLGARFIERHFTLDRTWKGTDHAASLEPDGMRRLVRDVRNVWKALAPKQREILEIEEVQRDKLKSGQIRWNH